MKGKIISIIVPAYNMEQYIGKCCDSLLISKYLENIEVIIVNDGSGDNTSSIAHEYALQYSGVFRVVDKMNGNYGSCINCGLKLANGDFIKVLDADDSFDKLDFEEYVSYLIGLKKRGCDDVELIITDTEFVDSNGRSMEMLMDTFRLEHDKPNRLRLSSFKRIHSLTHHSITYRTSILQDMDYRQTERMMYTDMEWSVLPLLSVEKYIYHPVKLYRYLMERDGQSMQDDVFVANMPMQISILKNMLEFMGLNGKKYVLENRKIVWSLIVGNIGRIYCYYLLKYRYRLSIRELQNFDTYLQDNYPHIYKTLDSLPVNEYMSNKFIKDWHCNRLKYEIDYMMFYVVSNVYHKSKKYWEMAGFGD
jgi:glycosyltransferase involved in cell wall biosynthesis